MSQGEAKPELAMDLAAELRAAKNLLPLARLFAAATFPNCVSARARSSRFTDSLSEKFSVCALGSSLEQSKTIHQELLFCFHLHFLPARIFALQATALRSTACPY